MSVFFKKVLLTDKCMISVVIWQSEAIFLLLKEKRDNTKNLQIKQQQ